MCYSLPLSIKSSSPTGYSYLRSGGTHGGYPPPRSLSLPPRLSEIPQPPSMPQLRHLYPAPSISTGPRHDSSRHGTNSLEMPGSAHASRSPSVISLSDSDAIPDVNGTMGHPHAHRAPSVISLTDSDSIPDVDESTGHPHVHRAPSVISISDSDSIPDVDGSTGHPHAHCAPSVISLMDSTPDINDTVDMDPPTVGLGRKRNVGSRGDSLTNPIVVEDATIWPGDFYVCDIAQCI